MTTATGCTHHWIISPADGRTSPGTCVHCGQCKMFQNHFELPMDVRQRGRFGTGIRANQELTVMVNTQLNPTVQVPAATQPQAFAVTNPELPDIAPTAAWSTQT